MIHIYPFMKTANTKHYLFNQICKKKKSFTSWNAILQPFFLYNLKEMYGGLNFIYHELIGLWKVDVTYLLEGRGLKVRGTHDHF